VLACNPCPCGEYHPYNRDNQCRCSELKRREYRRKISGPIADRIDITRFVEPLKDHEANDPIEVPESSATVRARVTVARRRQLQRYADTPWRLNSHVPGPALRNTWPLDPSATRRLDSEVYGGLLTRRGAPPVHRVAWWVAPLRPVPVPGDEELEIALRLRKATPLELVMLARGDAA
jgi:magnesium chelatase family protein